LQDVAGGGGEVAGQRGRVFDGGGEAHAAEVGGQGFEAGEEQHELVAAFGFGQCVDLVDHNPLKRRENSGGVFVERRRARDSGVVSRICGGSARWRRRWV
jgi:hypothetical protein